MLQITLLGRFNVQVDGQAVTRWPRRDARQLLKLLALQPEQRLARARVNALLWPDHEPGGPPDHRLNNAIYGLRNALEPDRSGRGDSRFVVVDAETVGLAPRAGLHVDAAHFEQVLEAALGEPAAPPQALKAALDLYAGPLLPQDEGEPWVTPRRDHLEQRYAGGLRALAQAELEQGRTESAIAALQRLTRDLPTDEAAHRHLMELFIADGRMQEAQRQFERCRRALAEELGVAPSAQTRAVIAGAGAPLEDAACDEVGERALRQAQPQTPVLEKLAFRPPTPPQRLIDREAQADTALRWLRSGATRLLTLSGPGGVGKTQLAIRIGDELAGELEHGACFVSLAELSDPQSVAAIVGRSLGLHGSGPAGWEATLQAFVAERRMLLVLDNYEHLLSAAALASRLLAAGPRLMVLCTSRTALNLVGEQVLSVPPLQLPALSDVALDALEQVPSVLLFVRRARAADASFRLTRDNAGAIASLCHRLDGLPLAIELAASRVKFFGVDELHRLLGRSFELLNQGRRDSPDRHRSLEAVLQWGYCLLPPQTQHTFKVAGLFAGGFTLAGMQGVMQDGSARVADALQVLLDHHLIVVDDEAAPDRAGTRRYRMLVTVRAFALDQLAQDADHAAVSQRVALYWAQQADSMERARQGGGIDRAFAWFDAERSNLDVAVAWAAEHDGALAHHLVGRLAPFWVRRGHGDEGLRWVRAIVDLHSCALSQWHTRAAYSAGDLMCSLGLVQEAEPYVEAALAAGRDAGDAALVGESLRLRGMLRARRGGPDGAIADYTEALAVARGRADDAEIAACQNGLGNLLRNKGAYAEATQCFRDCMLRIDKAGDARAASILFNLSLLARLRGDYADARTTLAQAVQRARGSHDLRQLGCALVDHGELLMLTGSVDDGIAAIAEALDINKRMKDQFLAGCALQQMGAALTLKGRAGAARELLARALAVHKEAACADQADITLLWLTRACRLDGDAYDAAFHFSRLLASPASIRHYLLPSVLEEGAALLHEQGQHEAARDVTREALALRERHAVKRAPAERSLYDATLGATGEPGESRLTGAALATPALANLLELIGEVERR